MVRTKDIAVIVALALSLKVAGQTTPSLNKLSDKKNNASQAYSTPELSDMLKFENMDVKYFKFEDKKIILHQYDNIPERNKNPALYDTLLFDEKNNYFCFVYPQTGEGLHKAFLRAHNLLEMNGVDEHKPLVNIRDLPPGAPSSVPKETVHKENKLGYIALNAALSKLGYSIYEEWNLHGHRFISSFNEAGYILKISK